MYWYFCKNLLFACKKELARAASTDGSNTPTSSPAILFSHTPASVFASAESLDNKLFKQFIKGYLEA